MIFIKMVGPQGLERPRQPKRRTAVFDLPIIEKHAQACMLSLNPRKLRIFFCTN
jgi:hypothetical protein